MIFVTSSSTYGIRKPHQHSVDQEPTRLVGPSQLKSAKITHLHVLEGVLLGYAAQHILLAAFLELSRQQELVEDVVGLGEGEYDVELADVAVVLVHLLDVSVDDFEAD